MESIEKIKSTYSRIAEEAQQESNKIQQAIYHTGSLRLLLFVAGIAGIIYFREESWTILAGIALVTLLPFILLIKYHWLPNCNSASTSASSACCTKAQQPTKPN